MAEAKIAEESQKKAEIEAKQQMEDMKKEEAEEASSGDGE